MKKIIISLVLGISILLVFLYLLATPLYYTYLNNTKITELSVEWNTLTMNNLINSKTPEQFKKIFKENPNIDNLVMKQVDGSIDDTANLQLAKWISKKDLTFILLADSMIASGWTDFFLAGKNRIIHKGAQIGVHSWAGTGKTAVDYPVWDAAHQPYIDYYISLGWDKKKAEEFYYFTINQAPADGMHWMSEEEIEKYGLNTEEIQ